LGFPGLGLVPVDGDSGPALDLDDLGLTVGIARMVDKPVESRVQGSGFRV